MRSKETDEKMQRAGRSWLASLCPSQIPGLPSRLLVVLTCMATVGAQTGFAQAAEPIPIPLQHVTSGDDEDNVASDENKGDVVSDNEDDYDSLGIMVGINSGKPRLYEFDTGSDEFMAQIDPDVPDVKPIPGTKPEMYPYGDSTYGYWLQKVRFDSLSYYDPEDPSKPIATPGGSYVAGQVLDWVYTKAHDGFKDLNVTRKPIDHYYGMPLYADLDVRKRVQNGEPSDTPPFYGTFGAGDFVLEGNQTTAPGSQTQSGYVVSANANLGRKTTPGCAPCLTLNLSPGIRSQFSALMPWGKLDHRGFQRRFPQSDANASNLYEGSYRYTISVKVGSKKRAIDFTGPILFDTGTESFIYAAEDNVVKKLRSKGFKLKENSLGEVDVKLYGFKDKLNDLEFDDVVISRQSDEDEGHGLVIGLPFFQSNSIMYDLENGTTAYSPFFVTINDITTDAAADGGVQLSRATSDAGSGGWLGLAGEISGSGDFTIEKDAVVRMTGANTYTGKTHIASGGYLYLAGPGSIEHSSEVVVEGVLHIEQMGNYLEPWGVAHSMNDAAIRNLSGTGDVYLGACRLILTAADGQFDGTIADYDDAGDNMGGGLVVASGKLTLSGENDYSGVTEVAAGAELHVTGSLAGDVSVSGLLVVDGEVSGTVTVEKGGRLTGPGKVGSVTVTEGGKADPMNTR